MLLEFKTKNYRSFKDTTTFSMQPAPKQTGLDYSVQTEQIVQKEGKLKEIKGLCSAVIYGPNAAGKTNLIGAMDTMRAIVLRGNIQNASEHSSPNEAAYSLELIPNNFGEKACTEFAIRFTESSFCMIHNYSTFMMCTTRRRFRSIRTFRASRSPAALFSR